MEEDKGSLKAKVMIVGDSGVGKSSILARFVDDAYLDKSLPTIGVDFRKTLARLPGNRYLFLPTIIEVTY